MAAAMSNQGLPPQVPLTAVLTTAELKRRISRIADYETESRALVELAGHMSRAPQEILQRLVETALRLCRAGSCGVSIIEPSADGGPGIFRWHALTGALASHLWGTTPRDFSPCGTVVDSNAIQLMALLERHFTYFANVKPQIIEALLVPFSVEGKAVGTVWVVTHDTERRFDAEDARLIASLGHFASAAYQVQSSFLQIQAADRRKDEFLATLAHELRNPLGALQSVSRYLKARSPETPDRELRAAYDVNQRQLDLLTRMVDDLLDVSRITQNKLTLRIGPVNVPRAVQDAIETSRPLITAAGHALAMDLPDPELSVSADRARLAQVIGNLISNAAKYTAPGGRIAVSAHAEGNDAVIRVCDSGIGIAPDMLPRIFEPFVQAEGAREQAQGGLGIGLTLVRQLITLHGGTVEARSGGLGLGSEFIVRLNRTVARGAPVTPPAKHAAADDSIRSHSLRILVVDDSEDSANSLALVLQISGHEVRACYDGASALKEAAVFRPQLTLQDLGMPGMGGLELARRLREAPGTRDTVLVALSGYGQPEDIRATRDAGFTHHLIKPVDFGVLQQLLNTIPRCLEAA